MQRKIVTSILSVILNLEDFTEYFPLTLVKAKGEEKWAGRVGRGENNLEILHLYVQNPFIDDSCVDCHCTGTIVLVVIGGTSPSLVFSRPE